MTRITRILAYQIVSTVAAVTLFNRKSPTGAVLS